MCQRRISGVLSSIYSHRSGAGQHQRISFGACPQKITASDSLEQQEERKILLDAVLALGDPDAKIVILKYYFGYPTKKIAEIFGLKENTVDQKVRCSLAKVKTILEGGAFHEG